MLSIIECIMFVLQDTLNLMLNYARVCFDWEGKTQNLARTSQILMGIPDVSGSLGVNLTKKKQKEDKSLDTGQEFLTAKCFF